MTVQDIINQISRLNAELQTEPNEQMYNHFTALCRNPSTNPDGGGTEQSRANLKTSYCQQATELRRKRDEGINDQIANLQKIIDNMIKADEDNRKIDEANRIRLAAINIPLPFSPETRLVTEGINPLFIIGGLIAAIVLLK